MDDSLELNDEIYEKVINFTEEGDELLGDGEFDKAIEKYSSALELLPDPKFEWEASTYIYTALGDSYFLQGKFREALTEFQCAFNSPDGPDNPYVCLMLGESHYEMGDKEKAKEFLLNAYHLEGKDIFDDEDEKYFNLIKDLV